MNQYVTGAIIRELREKRHLTQAELAERLYISDKTVSKWENGQAFPRIETFERLAQVLGTTMQDILSASRDGVRRVCFYNDMCPVLQIDVDGTLALLRYGEARWLEVESDELTLKVRGDGGGQPIADAPVEAGKGVKLWNKVMRAADKVESKMNLHVECTYRLTNVTEDSIITIVGDTIDTEDPAMLLPPFYTDYPRVKCEGIGVELVDARGLNKRDAISAYKKMGLICLFDEYFLFILLTMPFWGLIGRWHCRSKVVARRIRSIDAVRERQERELKKYGWLIVLLIVAIVLSLAITWVASRPTRDVPVGRTYEISDDRSRITCDAEVYLPIRELPADAEPVMMLDKEVWEDAVVESDGFWDFLDQDNMVQIFVDDEGRIYLWLVEDYYDTMHPEDGCEPGFEDFVEHMLFAQE